MAGRTTTRRVVLATASSVSFFAATFAFQQSAGAFGDPNCAYGANSTASACLYFPGATFQGASTQWHNLSLNGDLYWLQHGNHHINQSIWLYTTKADGGRWIEIGLTQGLENNAQYQYYAAKQNDVGGVKSYQAWTLGVAALDNSTHSYELHHESGSLYTAWLDGVQKLAVSGFSSLGATLAQTGLEVSGINVDANSSSQNFTNTPLKYKDNSNVWHTGWASTSQAWNDWPCGLFSPPYCLNGGYYGTNLWQDNKP